MGIVLAILVLGYVGICIFLVFLILLQAGKGGGLSGLMGTSALSDTFGATGAQKTLSKWTTILAILFLVLSLGITVVGAHHFKSDSLLEQLAKEEARSAQSEPFTVQAPVEAAPAVTEAAPEPEPVMEVVPETTQESVEGEVSAPEPEQPTSPQ